MDHLTADLAELRAKLVGSRRAAWVRAVVAPVGEEIARLLAAQIVVGPRPERWVEQTWRYEQCTFVAARVTAARVASWCRGGKRAFKVGSVRTTIDLAPGNQVPCVHVPSLAEYAGKVLEWPAFLYTAHLSEFGHVNAPQEYLVGVDDVPSFPTFSGAFNAFFFDSYVITGVGNPEFGRVSVHIVDQRARPRGPHRSCVP